LAMLTNISHEDLGIEKIKKILEANGLKWLTYFIIIILLEELIMQ